MPIRIIVADITSLHVDAIVNAANSGLLGGGGVDAAIHRVAGPGLLAACRALPESSPGVRCPVGDARMTPGFALPAAYVIHTVGPIWRGGRQDEALALASCYREAMALLREHDLHSIAFPAISCGVYGYPAELAAAVAVATLRQAMGTDDSVDVTLCSFSEPMLAVLKYALNAA